MKLRQLFENRGNSVGVCFGRWNPPHKGHKAAWEIAASFGTFYVGTNKNTEGPNDPLPYEVKLKAMETIWPEIAGHVIPEQSLFTLVSKIFAKHGEHTHLKVATDEEWLAKSLMQYNGKEGAHGYYKFASIEQVPTPRLSSATALRAAVRAGDRDGFSDAAGVDADTPIRIGKKTVAFFDLVAHYLAKHPEKVKKVKKVAEHKKGVRAIKYTKKPVNPSAQHAKAKEKLAPVKPGIEKQTDECAGVGTITKQNSTGDVNKGTPYKNLKAFNLVKEGVVNMQAVAEKAKQLLAQGMTEQQVTDQLVKQGIPVRYAQQAVQAAQMNEIAGAFPSPSTKAKWAADAAASNAAEAKRLAAKQAIADAERLRVNNAIVDKEQRINYHPMPDNEVPVKEVAMRMQGSSAEEKAANAAAKQREAEEKAKHLAIVQAYVKIIAAGQPLPPKMQRSYDTMPDFRKEVDAALKNIPGQPGVVDLEQRRNYHLIPKESMGQVAKDLMNPSGREAKKYADFDTARQKRRDRQEKDAHAARANRQYSSSRDASNKVKDGVTNETFLNHLASEMIKEAKGKKISKRAQQSTKGLNTYGDAEHISGDYTSYRLGMAVAGADGKTPPDIDAKSWVGKSKTTHPYTQEEQDMLKHAYKAVGASYKDVNNGDMASKELDSVNKVSPIASPKRNKYGV